MKTVLQTLILFFILATAHMAIAQARLLPDRLIFQDPNRVFLSASVGRMFIRADDFMFLPQETLPTNRIIIDTEGNLLIGKEDSGARLHIKQNSLVASLLTLEAYENNDRWGFDFRGSDLGLRFRETEKGKWLSSDGSYVLTSDRRLKDNINLLQDGVLKKLMQLKPSTYYYKDDQKRREHSYGFIAQEVQEVFPEVVVASEREDEPYMINYTKVGVLAVKAIQELKIELDIARSELQELRSLVKQLTLDSSSAQ